MQIPNPERLLIRWRDFVSGGVDATLDESRYRRHVLVTVVLLAGVATTLSLALIDLGITHYFSRALAEGLAGLAFAATLGYLRRGRDVEGAAMGAVLVCLFAILAMVISSGTRDFALFWSVLFPPVAFLLLGPRRGLFFTLVFCGIALVSLVEGMDHWAPASLNAVGMVNIGGALAGLVACVYYYEVSRATARMALEQAATTDSLTGLPNRRRFQELCEAELERADRHGLPLSLLLLDIDHFKRINDTRGQIVGDAVIRRLASVLLDNLRRSDAVGRLGGEEFGVLLPHTSALQAARVAEKLRHAAERAPVQDGAEAIAFTISVGVAENGPSRADASSLLAAADVRLNRAKQQGRNRIVAV